MADRSRPDRYRLAFASVVLLLTAAAAPASAQKEPSAPETAPVVVDGRALFRLRGASAYPASERAGDVAGRIAAAADDPAVVPDSLRVVPDEIGLALAVQGRVLVRLLETDAAAESLRLEEFAVACRLAVHEAILDYRRDREPGRMLRSALIAGGAGIALALALLALIRVARRAEQAFTRRYRLRVEAAGPRGFQLVSPERLWWLLKAATAGLRVATALVLVYAYLQWALEMFPWTRRFGRSLLALVSDPLRTIVAGFVGYLPELVFLVVLAIVARWVLRALNGFLAAVERGTIVLKDFDAEWAMPTFRILRVVAVAFFVVIAYPYIPGSDSGAFKGVSLLLGLLLSLGSSSLVANMVAGYTMIYRRAFRVGDRIRVKDWTGDVVAIRPLVTVLRTPKNEDVVIPNSDVLTNPIVNYSSMAREGALVLHTTVGIGYEVPWRQVEAMLLLAAGRTDGLSPGRPPFVLQQSLGDFCVVYELNVHCGDAQRMATVYSHLHRNIQDVFNEHGVQIMTPAYEGDPERPKVVPKERWHEAPAAPSA